jgi:NitT/TauT family transport system substrate-binding protein
MARCTAPALTRRRFVASASAVATAALLGAPAGAAQPAMETRKIRLVGGPWLCYAPQYLAEDLLRLEGFSEIEFVDIEVNLPATLVELADLAIIGAPGIIPVIDSGQPVAVLSGLHIGCWELFARTEIPAVSQLKGRAIAVAGINSVDHVWISGMLGYVGIDPRRDVEWKVTGRIAESQRLFLEGKVDAFLGFPPQPQEVRARKVGHVLINTTMDRPWSRYFCCMVVATQEFVRRNPVSTKRALRAMLKAADLCAERPEQAARYMVDGGYESRYDIALDVIKGLPYHRWRQDDPTDTMRFHALRLYEVGMIKASPAKIIAQGTDWRFLNELKREFKA